MRMCFLFLSLTVIFNPLFSENLSNEEVFQSIYENGVWGIGKDDAEFIGSSGSGSDPANALPYLEYLQHFFKEHNIKSVVDLGCGDWQLGRLVDWSNIEYLGVDVVESVIERNQKNFSNDHVKFVKADGASYLMPEADLLICKDVLQHLPFQDIDKIIRQMKKFKFCLITNDVDPTTLTCRNQDIERGGYRFLDLGNYPFRLKYDIGLIYASMENTKKVCVFKARKDVFNKKNQATKTNKK